MEPDGLVIEVGGGQWGWDEGMGQCHFMVT